MQKRTVFQFRKRVGLRTVNKRKRQHFTIWRVFPGGHTLWIAFSCCRWRRGSAQLHFFWFGVNNPSRCTADTRSVICARLALRTYTRYKSEQYTGSPVRFRIPKGLRWFSEPHCYFVGVRYIAKFQPFLTVCCRCWGYRSWKIRMTIPPKTRFRNPHCFKRKAPEVLLRVWGRLFFMFKG